MTRNSSLVALCSAVAFAAADEVPEWIHILPAGAVRTVDGRGPYVVQSLQSIVERSLQPGDKLPIDECHSTDKAAALGLPAPARGWMVELQAREDGIWARVEWTGEGRKLMADKAYKGISPAILHTQDKTVIGVLRASLTNTPNLQGLVSLHSEETGMDWKAMLIGLLGLDSGADDATIEAALKAKMGGKGEEIDLCSQVISHPTFVALQSELNEVTAGYNALLEAQKRAAAEAFVDGAIAEGRAGLKPVRDEYVALHMQDASRAERLIGAMVALKGEVLPGLPKQGGQPGDLNADDRLVMSLFGVEEEEYKAALQKSGVTKEAL